MKDTYRTRTRLQRGKWISHRMNGSQKKERKGRRKKKTETTEKERN